MRKTKEKKKRAYLATNQNNFGNLPLQHISYDSKNEWYGFKSKKDTQ